MLTIEINKTFANQAECDAWEEENLPNRTYNGHAIMCVNHECSVFNDKVTLTTILTF